MSAQTVSAAPTAQPVPPTAAPAVPATPAPRLKTFRLNGSHETQYAAQHFTITLPPGVTVDDCLEPEFWASSPILRPGAIIVVRDSRLTDWAEFLVRAVRPQDGVHGITGGAYLTKIRHHSFDPIKIEVKARGYEIRFLGPEFLWSIVRLIDNSPIATNFGTRDAAAEHLANTANSSV
jgi:hypothetical protein